MDKYLDKRVHVVSIDIPSPPDYGGVIDIYYKLCYFKQIGLKVILHCFEYGRSRDTFLLELCEEVHYYAKKSTLRSFSKKYPYVIFSRKNEALLKNLLKIDAPIFFEGVHTTYFLNAKELHSRRKIVRNHNIESVYFKELSNKFSELYKKYIYRRESKLIDNVERNLHKAYGFVTVTSEDCKYFKVLYPTAKHLVAPCFSDFSNIAALTSGSGTYLLYHGNLSHPENIEVTKYIINEIADHINFPIVIAGKNPSKELIKLAGMTTNVRLIANPDQLTMEELQKNAHIHLLLTFQATGLKLKLLSALAKGKHIVVNDTMLHGTNLAPLVHIGNSSEEIINEIKSLLTEGFSDQDVVERISFLTKEYNQTENALAICEMLFD